MNKLIGVFGNDIEQGVKCLEAVVGKISYKEIQRVRTISGGCVKEVLLKNGDRYVVMTADDTSRGYRLDDAYVSGDVNVEYVMHVILPMIINGGGITYVKLQE